MGRLRTPRLRVGGGGFGVPRQDFGAQSIQLLLSNLADDVVLLEGILLQVVVLFFLVAVVVDVLLLPLDPGSAQQVRPAAEEQGAILGQGEQRASRVLAVYHLVAEHVPYGRGDVQVVRRALDSLAAFEALGVVDDQGHPQTLLPDRAVVMVDAVLAEGLPVVAIDYEDGVLVETQTLVLLDYVLDPEVVIVDVVEVAVEHHSRGELLPAVAGYGQVVVMGRDAQVHDQGGAARVLLQPRAARLEHDVVLVAEVVGSLEAPAVHGLIRLEVLIAEVLHQLRAVLEGLLGRLELGALVALLTQKLG